jgi:hypothetical protein
MPQILDYSPNVKIERSGDFVDTGNPKLHNLNNINSDDYNQRLSTAQSMSVGAYELTNFIPNDCGQKKSRDIQTSQVGINFNAGHEGGKNGCLMDQNNVLKFEELTNKNYINQLYERLTLTTPYIRGLYDVDVESVLQPGEKTDLKKPCNTLAGKSLLSHYYTPMVPKLKKEVQNTDHIIPEDSEKTWVRGGLPTRQIMRNIDYEKRCETK